MHVLLSPSFPTLVAKPDAHNEVMCDLVPLLIRSSVSRGNERVVRDWFDKGQKRDSTCWLDMWLMEWASGVEPPQPLYLSFAGILRKASAFRHSQDGAGSAAYLHLKDQCDHKGQPSSERLFPRYEVMGLHMTRWHHWPCGGQVTFLHTWREAQPKPLGMPWDSISRL